MWTGSSGAVRASCSSLFPNTLEFSYAKSLVWCCRHSLLRGKALTSRPSISRRHGYDPKDPLSTKLPSLRSLPLLRSQALPTGSSTAGTAYGMSHPVVG